MIITKHKSLLFLIILSLFIVSNIITLNLFDMYNLIKYDWLPVFIITLIFLPFIIRYPYILTRKKFFFIILWEIFIISLFLSKFLNNDFNIFEFLLYFVLIPLVFFNSSILLYKKTVIVAGFLSVLPFLLFLGQWNRLAILLTISGITMIPYFSKMKSVYKYSYLIGLTFTVFLTEHRTSLVTLIIVISITIMVSLLNNKKISLKVILGRMGLSAILIGLIYLFYDNVLYSLFNKWGTYDRNTSDLNSLTSGRMDIWTNTVKDGISLFGKGEIYFEQRFGIYHAHNQFVQILGAYGILSLLLYTIILIYIIVLLFKNNKKTIYLYFFFTYFAIGITEYIVFINTFFIYPSILFFVFLGSLINEKIKSS